MIVNHNVVLSFQRSVVEVVWQDMKKKNAYRVGYKGKVITFSLSLSLTPSLSLSLSLSPPPSFTFKCSHSSVTGGRDVHHCRRWREVLSGAPSSTRYGTVHYSAV